ncbi:MAG: DUF4386 family protein [Burkholderiales bacterium]|nr:DUF4386 family protein [Burkholderiales bacterium]
MRDLQRIGGLAALTEALIYVAVFAFYGAVWDFPASAGTAQKLAFFVQHQTRLASVNLLGYVVFGILLAVLVLALHERLKHKAAALAQLAAVFGLVWVGLVIASGMIANIGLAAVVKLAGAQPEQAGALWSAINTVVEGLGGGNEVVGGLWALLVSSAALKGDALPRTLNYLGVLVGAVGVLTVYPAEVLTGIFGVSQIVWFAGLGLFMLRKDQGVSQALRVPA